MDKPPGRLPLVAGAVLIAAGWAAIYLGWRESADQRIEVGQIPYVISGGLGGLGLLMMGTAAVVVDAVLQAAWRTSRATREVASALSDVAERLQTPVDTVPETEETQAPRPRSGRRRKPTGSG